LKPKIVSVQQNIYAKYIKCLFGDLLANTGERVGHLKLKPNFSYLVIGSFLMVLLLVLQVQLFSKLNIPTMIAIGFFNTFFVFLLFLLGSKTILNGK